MQTQGIDILGIDNTLETLAIRASLEYRGLRVNTVWIGQAQHVLDWNKDKVSSNILLSCHGDNQGFSMPLLGEDIILQQPFGTYMTPHDISKYLHFDNTLIISNGCDTGTKAFGQAFVDAGARYYIAPDGYPEGDASLLYLTIFYYSYFCKNMSVEEAHFKAQSQDEETKMFQLYGK